MNKTRLLRISTVPHSLHLLLRGQLKFMKDMGLEVWAASAGGIDVKDIEQNEQVKHFDIPLTRSLSPIKDLVALFHIIKLIRKLKPDIVHTHSPKAGTIGMIASFICRVPLKIHTVAGLPLIETSGFKRRLLVAVERLTYSCADWVLPNSIEQCKFIQSNIFHNEKKLYVIGRGSSNGIDLSYFSRTPSVVSDAKAFEERYSIDDQDTVLSFVGRLANYKGVNELVAAFKALQTRFKRLKLVLVGPIEELNPLNSDTLAELQSNKNIICTGHQPDIRPYLAASDIFVFPSYREGFPQSLMQASAMGLPCVASNINGCNEIVFEGVNGLLVEPKSVDELIRSCEDLIGDTSKRERLAIQGRKFLEDHFDQKKLWQQIYEFYKTHLNGRTYSAK